MSIRPSDDDDGLTGAHRLLALAVIYRAVLDARKGDDAAREWLLTGQGAKWAELLGVQTWPPVLSTFTTEYAGQKMGRQP